MAHIGQLSGIALKQLCKGDGDGGLLVSNRTIQYKSFFI
jgi:hypothetical protein